MTTPPTNVDELVSAYLDGEAAPDEVALVEATPSLLARAEELRAVADGVGSTTAPPQEQKEAHLGAALAAFDDLIAASPTGTLLDSSTTTSAASRAPAATPANPRDNVRSMAAARFRKRPRRINALAAAAAMIAVVFLGITALSLGGSSGDDVASEAPSAEDFARSAQIDTADSADSAAADGDSAITALEAPAAAQATTSDDETLAEESAGTFAAEAAEEPADESEPEPEFEAAEDLADDAGASNDAARVVPAEILDSHYYLGPVTGSDDIAKRIGRLEFIEPELANFETCQDSVPDLVIAEGSTLVAIALLGDDLVEIHQIPESAIQLIVDRDTCVVIDELDP